MSFNQKYLGTPMYGDGRKTIHPDVFPFGTRPAKLRRSSAVRIVEQFLASGQSHHSVMGTTMWVVVSYAHKHKLAIVRRDQSIYLKEKLNGDLSQTHPIGYAEIPGTSQEGPYQDRSPADAEEGRAHEGGQGRVQLELLPVRGLPEVPAAVQAEAHRQDQ